MATYSLISLSLMSSLANAIRYQLGNGPYSFLSGTISNTFSPSQMSTLLDYLKTNEVIEGTVSTMYYFGSTIIPSAFINCSSLSEIYLPNCIDIAMNAFADCTALKNVYIYPTTVPNINIYAFYNTPIRSGFSSSWGTIWVPNSFISTIYSQMGTYSSLYQLKSYAFPGR